MIAQIKPQLLITQSPLAKKDITSVESAGTRVLILSAPNSVEELYQSYVDMATVFAEKLLHRKAETALSSLKAALDNAAGTFDSFAFIMTERCALQLGTPLREISFRILGKTLPRTELTLIFQLNSLLKVIPNI
jgi:hypothetical protein